MPLSELKRRRGTGSNRQTVREDRSEAGRTVILARPLEGGPPFFQLTQRGEQPLPKPSRVAGHDYWGSGWSWAPAVPAAEHAITPMRKRGA